VCTCPYTTVHFIWAARYSLVTATKIACAWPTLTVSEGSVKKIHCENNLYKINLILTSATADAENFVLTEVNIQVEHIIYSLEFFPRNCNLMADVA